ncbi:MAG: arsenate reductase ArsC [Planctomycetes bacterium]|nr:arsenate reductase ArsC [Planctomycetota bacterium]
MANSSKPTVLFLCTRNACRSQLAEGLMRQRFGDRLEVYSAGVAPTRVHPLAVRALKEVGIDASGQRSKHVGDLADLHFDLVVTLCDSAREACPVFPGDTRVVHRTYRNPDEATGTEEERLAVFRQVRDQLARELPELIGRELGITPLETDQ